MFKVIRQFYDLTDKVDKGHYFYKVGDVYPREGMKPTVERIAFLASSDNLIGEPVIELIEETPEEPAAEEKPKRRAKK